MAKRPAAKAKAKKAPSKAKARKGQPAKKAAKKVTKPVAKNASKTRTVTVVIPQMITLSLPPVLHDRLKGLSQIMGLSTEGVIRQALTEFADTWEDHHRTVAALADTGDRMQIVQKD